MLTRFLQRLLRPFFDALEERTKHMVSLLDALHAKASGAELRTRRIIQLLDALHTKASGAEVLREALRAMVAENKLYRERARTAGDDWKKLCMVLDIPATSTFASAAKLMATRYSTPKDT